ncbi:hypothetical protein [Methanocella conradii]|uniref:hypothetical protein n=1 Tax=Methanocella conradii TaxID=1175444 RepID=UPI00157D36E6|nr:hypothetical protein [Methanocella conradii]
MLFTYSAGHFSPRGTQKTLGFSPQSTQKTLGFSPQSTQKTLGFSPQSTQKTLGFSPQSTQKTLGTQSLYYLKKIVYFVFPCVLCGEKLSVFCVPCGLCLFVFFVVKKVVLACFTFAEIFQDYTGHTMFDICRIF